MGVQGDRPSSMSPLPPHWQATVALFSHGLPLESGAASTPSYPQPRLNPKLSLAPQWEGGFPHGQAGAQKVLSWADPLPTVPLCTLRKPDSVDAAWARRIGVCTPRPLSPAASQRGPGRVEVSKPPHAGE